MTADANGQQGTTWLTLLLAVLLAGCAAKSLDRAEMMPAPAIFDDGRVDPFATVPSETRQLETEVLFATNRDPAADGDLESHYASRRGYLLRLGRARIEHGDGNLS